MSLMFLLFFCFLLRSIDFGLLDTLLDSETRGAFALDNNRLFDDVFTKFLL